MINPTQQLTSVGHHYVKFAKEVYRDSKSRRFIGTYEYTPEEYGLRHGVWLDHVNRTGHYSFKGTKPSDLYDLYADLQITVMTEDYSSEFLDSSRRLKNIIQKYDDYIWEGCTQNVQKIWNML